MEGTGDVIHRPSGDIPLLILAVIADAQGDLRTLGSHTQQCGRPHPEQSARPSGQDRRGYAHDIAAAHAACYRGAQGLVGGTSAGGLWISPGVFPGPDFFQEIPDCIGEKAKLDKSGHKGVKNAQTQQHHQHPVLPQKVSGCLKNVFYYAHGVLLYSGNVTTRTTKMPCPDPYICFNTSRPSASGNTKCISPARVGATSMSLTLLICPLEIPSPVSMKEALISGKFSL